MSTTRDAVAAAFDKLEAAGDSDGGPAAGTFIEEGLTALSEGPPADPASTTSEDVAGGEAADDSERPPRARGLDGKFTTKATAKTEAPTPGAKALVKPTPVAAAAATKNPAEATTPGAVAAPATATKPPLPGTASASELRAPQSWKPAERELWAKVPPEARAVIDRREREIATALQESAEPRKFHENFKQALAPFDAMLGGSDRIQATRNLMQAAHTLNYAPPQQKAQLLARMILDSGAPLDLINEAMGGGQAAPQAQQAQPQPSIDPAQIAAQVRAQLKQEEQQTRISRAVAEFNAFIEKADFGADVRQEVVDEIDRAARRGVEMPFETAYNRVLKLHKADEDSEIGKVLRQREQSKQANAPDVLASTQRSIAAGSSVKSQPAPRVSGGNKPSNTREAVEAAWASLSRK